MKIKIVLVLLLIALAGTAALMALWTPYHFYRTAVTEGIQSEFLNLGRLPPPYYSGAKEVLGPVPVLNENYEQQKLWQKFHFSDVLVPLPLHHPEINFYPLIEEGHGKPLIGGRFVNHAQTEVFSFMLLGGTPFTLRADKEKLFSLPAVKQMIFERKAGEIWGDLFSRDIARELEEMRPWDYLSQQGKYSISDMLYNLFLLHMRTLLFRTYQLEALKFLEKNGLGIVVVHDIDERYNSEYVLIFTNGLIYKVRFRTMKGDPLGKSIRDLFLTYLSYEESNVDSSQKLYAAFRNLPYRTRIEQEGMVYLYTAWSHVTDKVEFLREMIQFLERGQEKLMHLNPLYVYAYKKFGDLLSKESDAQAKLKKKIEEEAEKELEAAKKLEVRETDGDYLKGEEREQYMLKKAKGDLINSDQQDHALER